MKSILLALTLSSLAFAEIEVLPSRAVSRLDTTQAVNQLRRVISPADFRAVKLQPVGDHSLVYLVSKTSHRRELAHLSADGRLTRRYRPTAADRAAQSDLSGVKCPDDSVELVSMVPTRDKYEIAFAKDVAKYARAKGLKTVELYGKDATRVRYMSYLRCPKLRGNFYDGDSDEKTFDAADGMITSEEIATVLKGQWNYAVTNIWVACDAYNDPMLSSVTKAAQAKKYAAGKNDLDIGPADKAAVCGMKAALDGKPMTESFAACVKAHDNARDQWGFGGDGGDVF